MNIMYIVSRPLEINTSSSIRNRATIQGLILLGHNVKVVTTAYDKKHNSYDKSLGLKDVEVQYIELSGIQSAARLGRKLKILNPVKKLVYNFMNRMEIYDNLKGIINHIDKVDGEDVDVIISSSDPKSSHLFAEKLLLKSNKKKYWIQIWGDPFLADITKKSAKLDRKIKEEEKRLLSKANKIVYVSKLTLNNQKNIYPESSDKMEYIPIPYEKEIRYSIVNKSPKKFLYAGDYNSTVRNIKPLIKAFENSENELIICGGTDLNIKKISKNIRIMKRQTFENIKILEQEADVLVHLSNLHGGQIPGKIYQYSGTNKPILFILDGNENSLLNNFSPFNRYIFTKNNHEDILNILNKDDVFSKEYIPVNEFKPINIAQKILELEGIEKC